MEEKKLPFTGREKIRFNVPPFTGREYEYVRQAVEIRRSAETGNLPKRRVTGLKKKPERRSA